MSRPDPSPSPRGERFFRRLLRLFPAEFRGDFGDEMARTFRDQRDDVAARGGAGALLRLWLETVWGVLTTAPRAHWDLLRQDAGYGLRSLRRNPGFAVVAIAALAVGIGANTAIFSLVNGILLRPLPWREPERLVTLFEHAPGAPVEKFGFSAPDFGIVRESARSFEDLAAYRNADAELSGVGTSERVVVARVSPGLFPLLGTAPAIGRPFADADDDPGARVVLLGDALWRRAFGADPSLIGRTIALDREPYVVVGVMPRGFVFPPRGPVLNGEPAALYVPIAFTATERGGFGAWYNNSTVARLKPGVTIEQARADLASAAKEVGARYPAQLKDLGEKLTFPIDPLGEEVVGRSRRLLVVLMGAVGMVLLICCADVANLMLTRSGARQRELAIRSCLGASQVRIVRQLFTESVLLAVAGALAGLALAFGLLRAFLPAAVETLPRPEAIRLDGFVVLFTLALALATPLFFGVLPALRSALLPPSSLLADSLTTTTAGRARHRLLGALVIAQCALAVVLSVGAGLLVRSFVRLSRTDTGFQAEGVVNATMVLPSGRYATGRQVKAFFHDAVAAAAASHGATAAGAANSRPLNVRERRAFTPDATADAAAMPNRTIAGTWTEGRYFEALGIPLKAGRFFEEADGEPGRARVVILSEMLARRLWPNGDALGHQVKWGIESSRLPWMTIVGVVGDIKQGALDSEIVPQAYEPLGQMVSDDMGAPFLGFFSEVNLLVRSERPTAAVGADLLAAVRRLDPELAVSNVQPVPEIVDDSVKSRRFSTATLALFAAVALSLAALGVYGVLANVVAQQTKEIGVRLALGATASSVLWLVLRRALVLTAFGLSLGLAGALALTRLMSGLLYEVRPNDAVTFVVVSAGLSLLVLLAGLAPAWRATRVDPIAALRME
ncbi:MAG TPA: ABC transporter permease [Verrucomicrobiae bacterium]|nr:ABC transporter permease [Verrucomicrobiae bacterium]